MKFSIFNFSREAGSRFAGQFPNTTEGFTLIELLASIIVIVSVGGFILSILFTSLRGTNKTNSLNIVRQNGTYALTQMAQMFRFAQSIDAVDQSAVFDCTTAPYTHSSIKITNPDGNQTTLSCTTGVQPTIASTSATFTASLLDTSSVSLTDCTFTCKRVSRYEPLVIGISFKLSSNASGGTLLPERMASATPIEFTTSVTMRNISK